MSDNTNNAGSGPARQSEKAVSNQQYETAVPQQEVIEKGGYSPRPQAYDLSKLPNAPTGPAQQSAAEQPSASANDSGSDN